MKVMIAHWYQRANNNNAITTQFVLILVLLFLFLSSLPRNSWYPLISSLFALSLCTLFSSLILNTHGKLCASNIINNYSSHSNSIAATPQEQREFGLYHAQTVLKVVTHLLCTVELITWWWWVVVGGGCVVIHKYYQLLGVSRRQFGVHCCWDFCTFWSQPHSCY